MIVQRVLGSVIDARPHLPLDIDVFLCDGEGCFIRDVQVCSMYFVMAICEVSTHAPKEIKRRLPSRAIVCKTRRPLGKWLSVLSSWRRQTWIRACCHDAFCTLANGHLARVAVFRTVLRKPPSPGSARRGREQQHVQGSKLLVTVLLFLAGPRPVAEDDSGKREAGFAGNDAHQAMRTQIIGSQETRHHGRLGPEGQPCQ